MDVQEALLMVLQSESCQCKSLNDSFQRCLEEGIRFMYVYLFDRLLRTGWEDFNWSASHFDM